MKILLATDGSRYSEEAAWFLSHLPHAEKMDLVVLSVVTTPHIGFALPTKERIEQCTENEKRLAQASYAKIEEQFAGANIQLRHMVREGHAGETIVHHARGLDVDLVVVGARGHSPIDRILLGSTSDFVATHANCSVLVVRSTGQPSQKKETLSVAIAYDDSGPSQAAVEEICEFKWGANTDLRVVPVVVTSNAFSRHEAAEETKQARAAATRAAERAVSQLREVAPNAKPDHVDSEHVGEGIVAYAEEHQCDVLALGESDRSTLGRLLLGSVSTYVLRHAPCSVWIVRNRMIQGIKKASRQKSKAHVGQSVPD